MAPLACVKHVPASSIWLPVKCGNFLLLKETFLRNRCTKIHGSLCFQKKIMGWKKWRYNLIFTDLEAGMTSTEFHFCFLVGASKHQHFLRMGSIFLLNFHPYLACKQIFRIYFRVVLKSPLVLLPFPILLPCLWLDSRCVREDQYEYQGAQFWAPGFSELRFAQWLAWLQHRLFLGVLFCQFL